MNAIFKYQENDYIIEIPEHILHIINLTEIIRKDDNSKILENHPISIMNAHLYIMSQLELLFAIHNNNIIINDIIAQVKEFNLKKSILIVEVSNLKDLFI